MVTIGAIARRAGIRSSTVRYYEARGLLRPAARLPNGYRTYNEDAVGLLGFVRRAQALGITLEEVRKLLELSRKGQRPCAEVKALARRHLADLDLKIRDLELLRGQLQRLLHRRSGQSRPGAICPLIEQAETREANHRTAGQSRI
jgi:MerR family transcriptional regulator, copper efflux regulator